MRLQQQRNGHQTLRAHIGKLAEKQDIRLAGFVSYGLRTSERSGPEMAAARGRPFMTTQVLTGQQVAAEGLDGWTVLLSFGQGGLETRIHTESFAQGLRLVGSIGEAAETLGHHAELDLRRSQVDVRLSSRDGGGVTETDVMLARQVTEIAAAAGVELECRSLTRIELGLDTAAYDKIAPFWAAVLDSHHVIGTKDWGDVGDP
ncbi:MAG TPA: 4a-hydroxytetrahydrobiopterin dehydratase, partial [Kribbella sp.]|nr:4a-hydroxytetrahydrobiopterin dehydratase [Kribbella sp.]